MNDAKQHHDYYKTLQVHPDAAQEIIDAAYRALSKKYHPDISKHPRANEHMMEINLAYGVLSEPLKRKQYNLELIRSARSSGGFPARPGAATAPSPATEASASPSSAPVYRPAHAPKPTPPPVDRKIREQEEANRVLENFFRLTAEEAWEQAYQLLTEMDRNNVPLTDFAEWKDAVNKIYRLGSYQITFFKRFEHCEYAGKVYPMILQFSVVVREMNQITSQVSEETTQKYMAYDGNCWKVCLGYRDLKPNILKFRYMAQSLPRLNREELMMKAIDKIDLLTGLFNDRGFREQAEREILRSQRYGNPLSLGLIRLEAAGLECEEGIPQETRRDGALSYVADVLNKNIRRTDLLARWSEDTLVLLFTETKLTASKRALQKLLAQCEQDQEECSLSWTLSWSCANIQKDEVDKTVEAAQSRLQLWQDTQPGLLTEDGEGEGDKPKKKLGKYGVRDILSFNHKGKNHF